MTSRIATTLTVVACCAHVLIAQQPPEPAQPTIRVLVDADEIDARCFIVLK